MFWKFAVPGLAEDDRDRWFSSILGTWFSVLRLPEISREGGRERIGWTHDDGYDSGRRHQEVIVMAWICWAGRGSLEKVTCGGRNGLRLKVDRCEGLDGGARG